MCAYTRRRTPRRAASAATWATEAWPPTPPRKRIGWSQPAASANSRSARSAQHGKRQNSRRPHGDLASRADPVAVGGVRGVLDRERPHGQGTGDMLRDGGGRPVAGAGEAAQGRTQLGVLVGDQPAIHGSRRLGAGTAVDGHRRIAAADQQPGRGEPESTSRLGSPASGGGGPGAAVIR